MPAGAGYALEEFARRHGDFAIVGIAAVVVREGQRCKLARLATAGAGPVPVRLRAAEEILERDGWATPRSRRRPGGPPSSSIPTPIFTPRPTTGATSLECSRSAPSSGRSESRVAD